MELSKSHNQSYITKLKSLIKEEGDRHCLIGLSVYLGSYNARKELQTKGFFKGRKDTLSKVYEAGYIARKQEEILSRLDEENPKSLILDLKQEIEKAVSDREVCKSDLSKCIEALEVQKHSLLLYEIGKRTETRLINLSYNKYDEYKLSKNEGVLCDILYKEEEAIRHGIIFEINR
ncbi:hypothetical protein HYV89_03850 [Candidatus Woesearchaeota archaeon]|nr:hypothetical protein [Candidatus Woesearchaeota archaeon]